jgi:RNA recognition motif-containing protein
MARQPPSQKGLRRIMGKRLYVGNLSYDTTEDSLMQAFAPWGATSVTLPMDGGRPKGFGFVEIAEDAQASQAINAMNGKELDGRQLTVNEARPREDRGGGGRGGGYGGGGGGRGGRW